MLIVCLPRYSSIAYFGVDVSEQRLYLPTLIRYLGRVSLTPARSIVYLLRYDRIIWSMPR